MKRTVAASDAIQAQLVSTMAVERLLAWLPLALVIASFVAMAHLYSARVPVYEAPDEWAHIKYANFIAVESALPDMADTYEAWQPPLYYGIGGVTLKALGLESMPAIPDNPDNSAVSLNKHGPDEGMPYSSPFLAVHILRWITVIFGAGALVFVYLISLTIFPGRKLLALAAAATAGFVPQFTFTSGYVSNDIPAVFFATAVVYVGLRMLQEPGPKWALAAALCLALGGLTKSSVAVVAIVPVLACLLSQAPRREKAQTLAMIVAVPALTAGPFYIKSIAQWGTIYPDHLLPLPTAPRDLWDPIYRQVFLTWLSESYWYRGGWLQISLTPITYDVLNAMAVLGAAGVIVTFTSRRLSQFQNRALLLLVLTLLLAMIGVLYFCATMDFQAQGRFLFSAQSAIALLLVLGINGLFTRDPDRDHPAILAVPAMLFLVNAWVIAVKLPDAY